MILELELALLVDGYLKKIGQPRLKTIFDKDFNEFTKEQLDLIEELTLSNFHSLNGLEHFKNLKSLTIISVEFQKMNYNVEIYENKYLNHIKDFSKISELIDLEELTIENDINIKRLNITFLSKLKKLRLNNNPNLVELDGLDLLEELDDIFICGCNIENEIDFHDYLLNTYASKSNVIDINMYPDVIGNSVKYAKSLDRLSTLGYTNVKFAEQVGYMKYAILNPYNLKDMFIKVDRIISKNNLREKTDYEKVAFAYDYVVNNVTFAEDDLKKRYENMLKYSDNLGVIPERLHKNFAMIHTSYAALIYKKSNCEGFVNLMRFMLNILNVKTHNVHCTGKNVSNRSVLNHSSIRVKLNNSWYYCEPTWEKKGERNFFLKTKSEFEETHILNILEQQVEDVENERDNTRSFSRRK